MQEYIKHIARWASNFWGVSTIERHLFMTWIQDEKKAKLWKKVHEELSLLRAKKYFEWIIKQLPIRFLSDVKIFAGLGGCFPPRLKAFSLVDGKHAPSQHNTKAEFNNC